MKKISEKFQQWLEDKNASDYEIDDSIIEELAEKLKKHSSEDAVYYSLLHLIGTERYVAMKMTTPSKDIGFYELPAVPKRLSVDYRILPYDPTPPEGLEALDPNAKIGSEAIWDSLKKVGWDTVDAGYDSNGKDVMRDLALEILGTIIPYIQSEAIKDGVPEQDVYDILPDLGKLKTAMESRP